MDSEKESTMSERGRKLESLLAAKLTEFLESDVVYALRRVLAAEVNSSYRGPQEGENRCRVIFQTNFSKTVFPKNNSKQTVIEFNGI